MAKIALSLCDDYVPASMINKAEDNTRMLSSRSNSAVRIDHEPRDQDAFVVQTGHATRSPLEADANQQTWKDQGRVDHAAGQVARKTHEYEDATRHLGCFLKRQRKQSRCKRQEPFEAESDDDELEQLVCNMNGHGWEKLPFPITSDSGACASVVPTEWCNHIPIQNTQGSESGESFRAANGVKTPNVGERLVTMMTQEGVKRDMKFSVCVVTQAFGSVSQMCQSGRRVVFNPPWEEEWFYIEHIESGDKLWMEQQNGLYILNTKVAPVHKQTVNQWFSRQGFHGQVMP